MYLSVHTPAPEKALIDLESVKANLGIEDDTSRDALLQGYIVVASSAITELFGRELARQTYRLKGREHGGKTILLRCNPIDPDSVSITLDGEEFTCWRLEDPEVGTLYLGSGCGDWVITYKGGFLLPGTEVARGVVTDWTAATAYPLGAFVRPVAGLSALRLECTTAGTSGATEPTWPDEGGDTVNDGSVTWTARQAEELPEIVGQLAFMAVRDMEAGGSRPAGLSSVEAEGFSESYNATSSTGALSPEILGALGSMRARYGR